MSTKTIGANITIEAETIINQASDGVALRETIIDTVSDKARAPETGEISNPMFGSVGDFFKSRAFRMSILKSTTEIDRAYGTKASANTDSVNVREETLLIDNDKRTKSQIAYPEEYDQYSDMILGALSTLQLNLPFRGIDYEFYRKALYTANGETSNRGTALTVPQIRFSFDPSDPDALAAAIQEDISKALSPTDEAQIGLTDEIEDIDVSELVVVVSQEAVSKLKQAKVFIPGGDKDIFNTAAIGAIGSIDGVRVKVSNRLASYIQGGAGTIARDGNVVYILMSIGQRGAIGEKYTAQLFVQPAAEDGNGVITYVDSYRGVDAMYPQFVWAAYKLAALPTTVVSSRSTSNEPVVETVNTKEIKVKKSNK